MLKNLIEMFKKYDVDYEVISEKEITVPCPSVFASLYSIPQMEILKHSETAAIEDESYIHILENENSLSWLIVIPKYKCPEI